MPFDPDLFPEPPEVVTPGAENKPQIIATETQNFKAFIPTAPGHEDNKEPPKFPSK